MFAVYINTDIIQFVKPITFLGDSLEAIRSFAPDARRAVGFQLDKVQRGEDPDDWKPIKTVGPGVREIRVRDDNGAFRVLYVAQFAEAVYVLHAFQKKSQKTPRIHLERARSYHRELLRTRR